MNYKNLSDVDVINILVTFTRLLFGQKLTDNLIILGTKEISHFILLIFGQFKET